MVPQIWGTIAVVWTTITILVLKVFDIVLAMTNGQWGTQVLANQMFSWLFQGGGDYGRSAVIALVIMILVVPIMVWNIKNANAEMEGR
jgi:alpha-glucoside transport system permease protein